MTIHTTHHPRAWAPDVTEYISGDIIPNALMLQTSQVVGKIEGDAPAVRVPFVFSDGPTGFVPEGTQIPSAQQQFSEVVVQTSKLATLGYYSYETLAQPEAARLIVESLSRSLANSANAAYLSNAGGGPGAGPVGLLNAGIADGGAITDSLDALVDAVAGIESDGGQATHIITGPDSWANLSKLKRATDSNESLVGAGVVAAERLLLGLPVLVDKNIPAGQLVVMDKAAVVSAESPIRLARSEDAMFSSDVIAIRLIWRIGFSVQRPNRVVKLTTTPSAPVPAAATTTTKRTTTK